MGRSLLQRHVEGRSRQRSPGTSGPGPSLPPATDPSDTAADWADGAWTGRSWSGRSWSGRSWSGRSWSNNVWDGRSWSGDSWSGYGWSADSWSNSRLVDPRMGSLSRAPWRLRPDDCTGDLSDRRVRDRERASRSGSLPSPLRPSQCGRSPACSGPAASRCTSSWSAISCRSQAPMQVSWWMLAIAFAVTEVFVAHLKYRATRRRTP